MEKKFLVAAFWTAALTGASCQKAPATPAPTAAPPQLMAPAPAPAAAAVTETADPGHPSDATRAMRAQIESLGEKRVYSEQAEQQLLAALTHPDQDVRGHACWGLGRMAPQTRAAIPALVKAMADPVWAVQHNAAWALVQFGELARPSLVAALADPTVPRRVRAAVALAGMEGASAQAEPVLLAAWEQADADTRAAILQGLGLLKPPSAAAVTLITTSLVGPLAMAALESLGAMGPAAAAAVPALVRIAKDSKDKQLLRKMPEVLGSAGVASPEVTAWLQTMLDSGDEHLCAAASGALSQLNAVDALAAALKSPSKRVRLHAVQGLAAIAELTDRRLELLLQAFDDREWEVRLGAVAAFHGRQEKLAAKAIPALIEALKDEHEAVRGHAKATLDQLKAAIAHGALLKVIP